MNAQRKIEIRDPRIASIGGIFLGLFILLSVVGAAVAQSVPLPGDVDGDGTLTVKDVQLMREVRRRRDKGLSRPRSMVPPRPFFGKGCDRRRRQ